MKRRCDVSILAYITAVIPSETKEGAKLRDIHRSCKGLDGLDLELLRSWLSAISGNDMTKIVHFATGERDLSRLDVEISLLQAKENVIEILCSSKVRE
jgi:hypothetical protein